MAINDRKEIKKIIKNFGSQAVIASIDCILDEEKKYKVLMSGKKITKIDPITLSKKLVDIGVGEIFINSVDRDGKKNGYDIDFLENFCQIIKKPVIVCGGAGSWQDMYDVFLTFFLVMSLECRSQYDEQGESIHNNNNMQERRKRRLEKARHFGIVLKQ